MNDQNSKSLDILGIKPVGDALKSTTDATINGASAFLSRICLPAAEEFGLLLRDRVSHWRANNAAKIAQKAEALLKQRAVKTVHAHPRLVYEVIEKGSWSDDDTFQNAWAGMLATSCSEDGTDDGNVVFISLLGQLTCSQLKILNHAVEIAPKWHNCDFPFADEIELLPSRLEEITGISDIQRLDRELDHMRVLELIGTGGFWGSGGGFHPSSGKAAIAISALAMHLYVRGHGFVGSPVDYFDLKPKLPAESPPDKKK